MKELKITNPEADIKRREQREKKTLLAGADGLNEEKKLEFMSQKRQEFKDKIEQAGGDYKEAANLHYWYHQYCGRNAGYYRDVSRKWRVDIEEKAKKFGIDQIPLEDSWVLWGADMGNPPKEEKE